MTFYNKKAKENKYSLAYNKNNLELQNKTVEFYIFLIIFYIQTL